jgi:hypothetical protein
MSAGSAKLSRVSGFASTDCSRQDVEGKETLRNEREVGLTMMGFAPCVPASSTVRCLSCREIPTTTTPTAADFSPAACVTMSESYVVTRDCDQISDVD